MNNYRTPGVYVEEVPSLPPSVVPVETAVPVFIGYTEKNVHLGEDYENIPVKIKGFLEFVEIFGDATGGGGVMKIGTKHTLTVKVDADGNVDTADPFKANSTSETDINSLDEATYLLYYALKMYFQNGGGPCYIVSVGKFDDPGISIESAKLIKGLNAVKKADEPTLIVIPEAVNLPDATSFNLVMTTALQQCADLQDRFLICDIYGGDGTEANSSDDQIIKDFRNGIGSNNLRYGAVYQPWIQTAIQFEYNEDESRNRRWELTMAIRFI